MVQVLTAERVNRAVIGMMKPLVTAGILMELYSPEKFRNVMGNQVDRFLYLRCHR